MKKTMIALTAAALVASTAALAQGPNGGSGTATMQRSTAMMTHQMTNQYQYQYQTKNMVMQQGEGSKNEYKNSYKHANKNGVAETTDTETTTEE